MRFIIVTPMVKGNVKNFINDGDYIAAADKGYDKCIEAGIMPDICIGDFDSLKTEPLCEKIKFPEDKDETDTGLCLKYAIENGYKEVVIVGGLSGLLSHTCANLQQLCYAAKNNVNLSIEDEKIYASIVKNGTRGFEKRFSGRLSVFSAGDVCTGVTLKGVKFPLCGATIKNSFPIGVSNEFVENFAEISVGDGSLIVILE